MATGLAQAFRRAQMGDYLGAAQICKDYHGETHDPMAAVQLVNFFRFAGESGKAVAEGTAIVSYHTQMLAHLNFAIALSAQAAHDDELAYSHVLAAVRLGFDRFDEVEKHFGGVSNDRWAAIVSARKV